MKWIPGDEGEKKVKLFINKARYPQSTGKNKLNLTPHPQPTERQREQLSFFVSGKGVEKSSPSGWEPVGFLA